MYWLSMFENKDKFNFIKKFKFHIYMSHVKFHISQYTNEFLLSPFPVVSVAKTIFVHASTVGKKL